MKAGKCDLNREKNGLPEQGEALKPIFTPDGLYRIDLWRGCYLLLTAQEYYNGIKRAKSARRREANDKRTWGEGNIMNALEEEEE